MKKFAIYAVLLLALFVIASACRFSSEGLESGADITIKADTRKTARNQFTTKVNIEFAGALEYHSNLLASYHLYDAEGNVLHWDFGRTPLVLGDGGWYTADVKVDLSRVPELPQGAWIQFDILDYSVPRWMSVWASSGKINMDAAVITYKVTPAARAVTWAEDHIANLVVCGIVLFILVYGFTERRKIEKYAAALPVCVSFFVAMLLPAAAKMMAAQDVAVSGSYEASNAVAFSVGAYLDGSFQEAYQGWDSKNFNLHNVLYKAYNQLRYDLFGGSNRTLVVGKDGYIFEKNYIEEYLMLTKPLADEELEGYVRDLKTVQDELERRGIRFTLLITPSKAEFFPDKIPDRYYWMTPEKYSGAERDYPRLVRLARENGVSLFDTPAFIKGLDTQYPVFAKTGIHWTAPVILECVNEYLLDAEAGGIPVREIGRREYRESEKPLYSWDRDVYSILNVFQGDVDKLYYDVDYQVSGRNYYFKPPNIMIQGGSFGTHFKRMLEKGNLAKTHRIAYARYYESTWHPEGSWGEYPIRSFEEIDLEKMLRTTDAVIIELNQQYISRKSSEFVAYLSEFLQNSEWERGYPDSFLPRPEADSSTFTNGVHNYTFGWMGKESIVRLENERFETEGIEIRLTIPPEVAALLSEDEASNVPARIYIDNVLVTEVPLSSNQREVDVKIGPVAAKPGAAVYDIAVVSEYAFTRDKKEVAFELRYMGILL